MLNSHAEVRHAGTGDDFMHVATALRTRRAACLAALGELRWPNAFQCPLLGRTDHAQPILGVGSRSLSVPLADLQKAKNPLTPDPRPYPRELRTTPVRISTDPIWGRGP